VWQKMDLENRAESRGDRDIFHAIQGHFVIKVEPPNNPDHTRN